MEKDTLSGTYKSIDDLTDTACKAIALIIVFGFVLGLLVGTFVL